MRLGRVSILVRIARWSLIPGMVVQEVTLLGRVVKTRSRLLPDLINVGSSWNWVSAWLSASVRRVSAIGLSGRQDGWSLM